MTHWREFLNKTEARKLVAIDKLEPRERSHEQCVTLMLLRNRAIQRRRKKEE